MKNYIVEYSVGINETAVTSKGLAITQSTNRVEVADEFLQSLFGEVIINTPGKYYETIGTELSIEIEKVVEVSQGDAKVLRKYL
ncbi:hypothetical protein [Bacillus toyonensis]|uniref:hypothetical protein n=1 Tax=Bacillus toyonensis TaxID=155322 RepID=UPI002E2318DB|nr:hypothetical protein [Bacillus toyonensis]